MSIHQRKMAFFLILFFMIPGLAFAQSGGTLIGKVVDPEGKPIQGVSVTITCPKLPKFREALTTDKKGNFTVALRVVDVTYHYRFDKAGYQSLGPSPEGRQVFTVY